MAGAVAKKTVKGETSSHIHTFPIQAEKSAPSNHVLQGLSSKLEPESQPLRAIYRYHQVSNDTNKQYVIVVHIGGNQCAYIIFVVELIE